MDGKELPGFTAIHCSYCYGSIREIIRKLETFPHTEYSGGQWVDPNYILAKVVCGRSMFKKHDAFDLREMKRYELDLPPQAEFMGWRLPFMDLDKVELNASEIRRMAPCEPLLKFASGKLTGYE
jgi:hypothetical protein